MLDANVFLFMIFSKTWYTEKIFYKLYRAWYKYYTPSFVYKELLVWLINLCEKRNLDYYNYKNLADRLLSFVEIVEYDFYKDSYLVVEPEVNQIDPKDIDYVALSYKLWCPLWTNDKKLKQLKLIKVLHTEDLLSLYDKL